MNFRDWLESEEGMLRDGIHFSGVDGLNEAGWKPWLAAGLSALGLAGGARGDDYSFRSDRVVNLGPSQMKLADDEIHISSFLHSQETRKYLQEMGEKIKDQSTYIKDLFVEIIEEDKGGKKRGVLSVRATIQAPDEATAKAILINSVMKVAQEHGMGTTAVRGMKQMFVPEGTEGMFKLRMKLYPDGSYIFF